ncbi:non-structural maintenance of chromosomes element 3 homolog [Bolinopsis microptera]|uniref:non-structural maintenance of chromosomes element 3 homolog n=1 Tax=Bolinopsis microptera TaxID=2820187 RepID=UPI0030799E8D
MSQNKRAKTNGGLDDAQPSTSSSNTSQSTPDARALARSEQAKAQLSATDVKKLEVELARFLLFADKKNIPTKKQDIVKHVLKEHSRLLPSVLEGARKYLKQTFDYSVCEVEYNKNKYYILRNNIVLPELQQLTRPAHALSQLALLTIILSMIHMANNALDEADLWETLKILGIDKSETHVDFGEADKLLNEFVKQMYIEKHKLTTSKGLVTQLRWGMRAYHEVKMSDILLFVASIYDVDASVWKKQFSSHDGAMETPSL